MAKKKRKTRIQYSQDIRLALNAIFPSTHTPIQFAASRGRPIDKMLICLAKTASEDRSRCPKTIKLAKLTAGMAKRESQGLKPKVSDVKEAADLTTRLMAQRILPVSMSSYPFQPRT